MSTVATRTVVALASVFFPSPRIMGGLVVWQINGPHGVSEAGMVCGSLDEAARWCNDLTAQYND